MIVSIIVAVSENGVIGRDGDLPWRLSGDLRRFRELTMGHHLILGRRTYESLPGPLPGRKLIVISRSLAPPPEDALLAHSLLEGLEMAREAGEDEVFIGGGAEIFREALPYTDRMYLTQVEARLEGDTTFPAYDPADWVATHIEAHTAGEKDQYPSSFAVLERAMAPGQASQPRLEED